MVWFEQRLAPTEQLMALALILALLVNAGAVACLAYSNLKLAAVKKDSRYTRHSSSKRD